jgi:hypothetical protein
MYVLFGFIQEKQVIIPFMEGCCITPVINVIEEAFFKIHFLYGLSNGLKYLHSPSYGKY